MRSGEPASGRSRPMLLRARDAGGVIGGAGDRGVAGRGHRLVTRNAVVSTRTAEPKKALFACSAAGAAERFAVRAEQALTNPVAIAKANSPFRNGNARYA
ncbi:MAG: hypothetical protein IRY89_08625 [Pseudolabrys sp.]|nr:hypothetical protein [Pseudolabrys sp.]